MADEAKAVTGRRADVPPANTTLAERAAARKVTVQVVLPDEDPTPKPEKAVAKKAAASKG